MENFHDREPVMTGAVVHFEFKDFKDTVSAPGFHDSNDTEAASEAEETSSLSC